VFYPKGLTQARELHFASRQVSTIEVNGSFYSLISPTSYQAWYDETPDRFIFSVKGARYITHLKRLKDVEVALANFFASGLLRLREKLGPILWQLPPQVVFDAERLRHFFGLLPRTTEEAAALALGHDHRLANRNETRALCQQPIRHALEVRHPSFAVPAFVDLLREHHIAMCVADSAGLYPCIREVTADFVYVRLHGATQLYASGYGPSALARWAGDIRTWLEGRTAEGRTRSARRGCDVFVYFDNDLKVRAPFDAINLQRLLAGQVTKRLPAGLTSRAPAPIVAGASWRGVGKRRVNIE
jgi:uncharacterized protein YecE (DUF72 family)